MTSLTFDEKLQRYAELIVKVGLNLQPGQRLFIVAFSLDVAPVVRAVTASAYQNGSKLVSVLWLDEQLDLARYQYAPRDSFEEYADWMTNGGLSCIEQGDAYLQIVGTDPELLKDQDPELIATAGRIAGKHYKPIGIHQGKNTVQWSLVAPPTPGWATKVFPDKSHQEAGDQLWDAVFKACRVDESDPSTFWEQQVTELRKRREYLTEKQYTGLKYTALVCRMDISGSAAQARLRQAYLLFPICRQRKCIPCLIKTRHKALLQLQNH